MPGTKKRIAGYNVEAWKKSFRVEGMSSVVYVGDYVNDRMIEDFIHTFSHTLKAEQGAPVMNLSTMAALVRDDVTTITAIMRDSSKNYVFFCSRELAEELRAEDTPTVVVDTSRGLGVGTVIDIHDEPQVDAEDGRSYRWAFQKVDRSELERQCQVTKVIEDRLKTRRKQTRREQALAALGMSQDDVKALVDNANKE